MSKPTASARSLTPAAFQILLVLSAGARHGLGIADDLDDVTGGAVQLGPGTLYRTLGQLSTSGYIREVPPADASDDSRRRFYSMTAAGRAALEAEAFRYDQLSRLARKRGILPTHGRS